MDGLRTKYTFQRGGSIKNRLKKRCSIKKLKSILKKNRTKKVKEY